MKNDTIEKKCPCLAVLGTGSDVGKSVVATALCRIFSDRGVLVAPFKAQNMSNNSGVTPEGLEMGRAQIVQAEAARVAPHVDMNPVLLKPTSDLGCQVVLLGEVRGKNTPKAYQDRKAILQVEVCRALDRLRAGYQLVIMEGAGSCAEVNLMKHDMVNLPMAVYGNAPVILVADIHRGGVFAQIVGTLACLPKAHQDRVAGFIINRFRGDIRLFADGRRWIEKETGKPVFGVLPWYSDFKIADEDAVAIESPGSAPLPTAKTPWIAVIRIPHISNFTDIDPLVKVKGLSVNFVEKVQDLTGCAAVIVPGSKNTRSDLLWLRHVGWADRIMDYAGQGGHVLGICGGYQMLGTCIHDPGGIEGAAGSSTGLGLLPVETTLSFPKTTTRTSFSWDGEAGSGYEIHMGRTVRSGGQALFHVHEKNGRPVTETDGCIRDDKRIAGTYVHGLFDAPAITNKWLAHIGLALTGDEAAGVLERDYAYERLATHFKRHVDVDAVLDMVRL